jgi:hypothetical protein
VAACARRVFLASTLFVSNMLPITTLAATSLNFVQPKNTEDFRRYLVGDWEVRKAIRYKAGGISGQFEGTAAFSILDAQSPSRWGLVAYSESGTFTPRQSDTFEPMETRNRLLYDFSSATKADVYFDNLEDAARTDTEAIVSAASYLYSLQVPRAGDPRDAGVLEVLEVDEQAASVQYSGNIEVEAPNAFISTWRVRGPEQDGEISTLYKRIVDEIEDDVLQS